MGTAGSRNSKGSSQHTRQVPKKRRGNDLIRPSLRPATFPGGEGCMVCSSLQWERQVRATPKEAASTRDRFRRSAGGTTSSDLAAPGHLPRRGRLRRHCLPALETAGSAYCKVTTSSGISYDGSRLDLIRPSLRSATFLRRGWLRRHCLPTPPKKRRIPKPSIACASPVSPRVRASCRQDHRPVSRESSPAHFHARADENLFVFALHFGGSCATLSMRRPAGGGDNQPYGPCARMQH